MATFPRSEKLSVSTRQQLEYNRQRSYLDRWMRLTSKAKLQSIVRAIQQLPATVVVGAILHNLLLSMASELVDLEQTLQSLRISLSKRGSDALVSLQEAFRANDEGQTGTVSYAVRFCFCIEKFAD